MVCTNPHCGVCGAGGEGGGGVGVVRSNSASFAEKNQCVLVVKDVPKGMTDADFLSHFKRFGNCVSAPVKRDRFGECRSYGFVHYSEYSSAEAATRQPFRGCIVKFKTGAAAAAQETQGKLQKRRIYKMGKATTRGVDATEEAIE